MIKEKKKKKVWWEGVCRKEKMVGRKKEVEWKGNGSGLVYGKEGSVRMRIKCGGDEEELGMEIIEL